MPRGIKAADAEWWYRYLFRSINFFYRCGAVHLVKIGKRGQFFYNWYVELKAGNDPAWLKPHLKDLLTGIRQTREKAGVGFPDAITVAAPGEEEVTYTEQ